MLIAWKYFVENGYTWFVLAVLAWLIIPSVWKDYRYRVAPEYEDRAKLVARRQGAGRSGKNVYEIWYGTFETDSGQLVELEIPRQMYHTLKENEMGYLSWKGNKLVDFREEQI